MNIHYLQHVPFEGLGSIESILRENGHILSCSRLYRGEAIEDKEKYKRINKVMHRVVTAFEF
jgi:hypothetical protein